MKDFLNLKGAVKDVTKNASEKYDVRESVFPLKGCRCVVDSCAGDIVITMITIVEKNTNKPGKNIVEGEFSSGTVCHCEKCRLQYFVNKQGKAGVPKEK